MLFVLWNVPSSYGQQKVVSEFKFFLDKNDYAKFNNNTPADWKGTVSKNLGSQYFIKPYKTDIINMNLNLSYQIQAQSALTQQGEYPFFAYIIKPQISIDAIRSKDKVKERRGNLLVNVVINGECENLHLDYSQSYIPVKGIVKLGSVGGRAVLNLQSFNFDYSPDLWNLNFEKCKGPQGYEQVLKKNIKNYLHSKTEISRLIKVGIEEQLKYTSQN
ncbi:MAG: hypothetical protein KDD40_08425, partial [Bdellovibrionales bacterium]|nr:hypothetical protein [Bdellovibrionales bacterium]